MAADEGLALVRSRRSKSGYKHVCAYDPGRYPSANARRFRLIAQNGVTTVEGNFRSAEGAALAHSRQIGADAARDEAAREEDGPSPCHRARGARRAAAPPRARTRPPADRAAAPARAAARAAAAARARAAAPTRGRRPDARRGRGDQNGRGGGAQGGVRGAAVGGEQIGLQEREPPQRVDEEVAAVPAQAAAARLGEAQGRAEASRPDEPGLLRVGGGGRSRPGAHRDERGVGEGQRRRRGLLLGGGGGGDGAHDGRCRGCRRWRWSTPLSSSSQRRWTLRGPTMAPSTRPPTRPPSQ